MINRLNTENWCVISSYSYILVKEVLIWMMVIEISKNHACILNVTQNFNLKQHFTSIHRTSMHDTFWTPIWMKNNLSKHLKDALKVIHGQQHPPRRNLSTDVPRLIPVIMPSSVTMPSSFAGICFTYFNNTRNSSSDNEWNRSNKIIKCTNKKVKVPEY